MRKTDILSMLKKRGWTVYKTMNSPYWSAQHKTGLYKRALSLNALYRQCNKTL
jgi:lambda repressor-like predicted transcriptional regulator